MTDQEPESMYSEKCIQKQLRSVPKVESADEALREILKLATDKRGHLLFVDDNVWKDILLKAIAKLARRGIRVSKTKPKKEPKP